MPLVWVQYWTALPVVVDDGAMNDGSQSGGRVLSGAHPAESSLQHRLIDGESNSQLSKSLMLNIGALQSASSAPAVLIVSQTIDLAVAHHTISLSKTQNYTNSTLRPRASTRPDNTT